ncbi:MAG: UDP-N-acetylenolpyruvoylglucosamine reductase [Desulfurella sp.]|nr:MAG: UDP-N-acetylenolpyruvoylglucosamine reductase [Desulfurella multipotens]PMP92684.1 MAG: UDP-N-acetylenolpyruvoylglucosamine reductase [Desulfurella sp.]HEX14209.1 UDP-N-acetylmuramate dehydrogenase [Desulfurella acetivorans]
MLMKQIKINTNLITSFKQNGTCTLNVIENMDDLHEIEQGKLVGEGSNIIIRNHQNLYKLSKTFSYVNIVDSLVIVGGSTKISLINKILIKNGLSGLEFLGGVPASIGGCVRMNAGAFGKSISDIFEYAICYNHDKGIYTIHKDNAYFSYRNSNFKDNVILEVGLRLKKSNYHDIITKLNENTKIRLSKAPLLRTFGSVFKNPPNMVAGKLIEECYLKGKIIGDAMICKKHANYIVNLNKATADDVLYLIDIIKNNVYKKFNVELEEEVVIL